MSHVYAYALTAPNPNDSAFMAVSSLLLACMSQHMTVAPRIENCMANSRPIPQPAPATWKNTNINYRIMNPIAKGKILDIYNGSVSVVIAFSVIQQIWKSYMKLALQAKGQILPLHRQSNKVSNLITYQDNLSSYGLLMRWKEDMVKCF